LRFQKVTPTALPVPAAVKPVADGVVVTCNIVNLTEFDLAVNTEAGAQQHVHVGSAVFPAAGETVPAFTHKCFYVYEIGTQKHEPPVPKGYICGAISYKLVSDGKTLQTFSIVSPVYD
jgi:hypothetical protein